jgi:hypothetical protein
MQPGGSPGEWQPEQLLVYNPLIYSLDAGGSFLSPGKNLVWLPFATSLPPFTVVIVTSMNASDLPTASQGLVCFTCSLEYVLKYLTPK